MDGGLKDLSKYRFETAREDFERAKRAFNDKDYKLALNRSYYAIFHALRAVNCLDGFDSSKHKGVIAHFNHEHVKNGEFENGISKRISRAMDMRQKSDYEDFFLASREEAERQLSDSEYVISQVYEYLMDRL